MVKLKHLFSTVLLRVMDFKHKVAIMMWAYFHLGRAKLITLSHFQPILNMTSLPIQISVNRQDWRSASNKSVDQSKEAGVSRQIELLCALPQPFMDQSTACLDAGLEKNELKIRDSLFLRGPKFQQYANPTTSMTFMQFSCISFPQDCAHVWTSASPRITVVLQTQRTRQHCDCILLHVPLRAWSHADQLLGSYPHWGL